MNTGDRITYPNSDIKNAHSTRLSALERYWNEKRGNEGMPARAQIDPLEIARLLPIVLMAEIIDKNAYMRLLGSETSSLYGRETRGRLIGELSFGAFTPAWHEAVASIIDGSARASASGFYSVGARIYCVETVLLPLSDNWGKLRYIFGGLIIKPAYRNVSGQKQTPKSFVIGSGNDRNKDLSANRSCDVSSSFGARQE